MTKRGLKRHALLLCGAATIALATAGFAEAAEAAKFDIPAQPLSTALAQFGVQSQHGVFADSALTSSLTTRGVSGDKEAEIALNELLAGTGLSWRRDGQSFIIVRASDPQSGSAAGDGADQGTVQALIVTAQKREENIQDVPIAMSAFSQEDLTKSQVATGADLMTQVPNMTFTKTNFSSYSIQIRGIGTQAISIATDPAVAVAFNNTPFIRNRFFEQEFYDLQRVEVLRGPQGTLYGRNATAGVVNILSAKPSFRDEAKLSADVSNYNSTRLEGMINLPLVDDKVALRLAGAWTKRDGFTVNDTTGRPTDGRNLWSTRLSLRVEPTDHIRANLIWEHFQEDDDRLRSGKQLCHRDTTTELNGHPILLDPSYYYQPFNQSCLPASLYGPESFEAPNGLSLPYKYPNGGLTDVYRSTTQSRDLRHIDTEITPQYRAKNDLGELQLSIELPDNLALTSETGYNTDFIFSVEDYNRFAPTLGTFSHGNITDRRPGIFQTGPNGTLEFCDPQLGCADHVLAADLSTAKSRQFSEELRLASNYDAPLNFSLGANFLRYDTVEKYYVFVNTLTIRAAVNWPGQPIPAWPLNAGNNYECLPRGLERPEFGVVYDETNCNFIDPNPIGSLNDLGHNYFLSTNPYKLLSYAVFGEIYYNITDALKLTAGLRWTVDKKESPRIPSWVLASNTAGYPVVANERQEWREPTGRLTLDWKPHLSFTDDTLIYASLAHGYKAGGANPPPAGLVGFATDTGLANGLLANLATHPLTFGPEFVNAFEVGSKNTLLDGRLTLNGDLFYYDYTGYQISQIIDRSAVNYNFDAKIWGAELEADWRPLENFRLAFKGGFEKTRMADGSKAIDVMDRTAGHSDWMVVKPFPTFPSNCILPVDAFVSAGGGIRAGLDEMNNGNVGPCEVAYAVGNDPVTNQPYEPDPQGNVQFFFPGYKGFDPSTAPNHGAGFDKDLSGHELPNAPHFTASVAADYTLPLPADWLMTLHTDLYYQSEAWARVFNTPGYDKLKAFTNVNLAAIFSNEARGWKVMAYVKNVFDKDNITGAFLNSDDTGLTTNVFLVEPRLYGLRVTKEWTGQGWWTGANPNHTGPYPLTISVGGQLERHRGSYAPIAPDFISNFSAATTPLVAQNRDYDWGDGREVAIHYRPAYARWTVSAAARFGKTNTGTTRLHRAESGDQVCAFGPPYQFVCDPSYRDGFALKYVHNWSDTEVRSREEHTLIDFAVGHDVGLGSLLESHSSAGVGLRYADFRSTTHAWMEGIPDWQVPHYWADVKYSHADRFGADITADRRFKGAGPTISWTANKALLGSDEAGRLGVDLSATTGVLFGKQQTAINGSQKAGSLDAKYFGFVNAYPKLFDFDTTPVNIRRTKSTTVPVIDLSLGLSYEIQRVKLSTGYRWERYYNVLDAGYAEHKSYDRTIDGPYFKIAIGFGG